MKEQGENTGGEQSAPQLYRTQRTDEPRPLLRPHNNRAPRSKTWRKTGSRKDEKRTARSGSQQHSAGDDKLGRQHVMAGGTHNVLPPRAPQSVARPRTLPCSPVGGTPAHAPVLGGRCTCAQRSAVRPHLLPRTVAGSLALAQPRHAHTPSPACSTSPHALQLATRPPKRAACRCVPTYNSTGGTCHTAGRVAPWWWSRR